MLLATSAFGRIYDVAGREHEDPMARDGIRSFAINGMAAVARAYKKLHALRLDFIGKGLPEDRRRVVTVAETQILGEYLFKGEELHSIHEERAKANREAGIADNTADSPVEGSWISCWCALVY